MQYRAWPFLIMSLAAPLAHGAVLGVHVAWLGFYRAWLGVHGAWLCVLSREHHLVDVSSWESLRLIAC